MSGVIDLGKTCLETRGRKSGFAWDPNPASQFFNWNPITFD